MTFAFSYKDVHTKAVGGMMMSDLSLLHPPCLLQVPAFSYLYTFEGQQVRSRVAMDLSVSSLRCRKGPELAINLRAKATDPEDA